MTVTDTPALAPHREEQRMNTFNSRYPVGTKGNLLKDSGEIVDTEVRHAAYICNAGYAVAFFTGVSGYYIIERFSC